LLKSKHFVIISKTQSGETSAIFADRNMESGKRIVLTILILVLFTGLVEGTLLLYWRQKVYKATREAEKAIKERMEEEANKENARLTKLNIEESGVVKTLKSGNFNRSYFVHVPKSYNRKTKAPVLFVFHGGGDNAKNIEKYTGFSDISEENDFLVVYPDGYGARWADGRGIAQGDYEGLDEMLFIRNLIKEIKERFAVDENRFYATGFSAGGYLVHKIACEESQSFKAFAAVGAGFPGNLSNSCKPEKARSIMFILGTQDPSYYGWTTPTGVWIYSANETIKKWNELNECGGEMGKEGKEVTLQFYEKCKDGTAVYQFILSGWGHDWHRFPKEENTFDTSKVIMDFFEDEK